MLSPVLSRRRPAQRLTALFARTGLPSSRSKRSTTLIEGQCPPLTKQDHLRGIGHRPRDRLASRWIDGSSRASGQCGGHGSGLHNLSIAGQTESSSLTPRSPCGVGLLVYRVSEDEVHARYQRRSL